MPGPDNTFVSVCLLSVLNIGWGFVASIQAPFFPEEALEKGARAAEFGPIFGIIHLALFCTSPFVGKLIIRLGLSRVFKAGLTLVSVAALTFGFLTFIDDKNSFLVLAYILRMLEGVAGAILWTAMLSLLIASFPGNSGLVYSLVDATFGAGFSLGPVLGALLYNAGGFLAPFLISGGLIAVLGFAITIKCKHLMDHAERAAKDSEDTTQSSILPILKDPASLISLAAASASALTSGYVESLLELHLKSFSISVSSISFCFLALALAYTLVTILVGYIADKTSVSPWSLMILGHLLLLSSFTLIGPAPWLIPSPSLPLTICALFIQGAGSATVVVSSYSACLLSTLSIPSPKYPDSVSTFSLVSGVWTSAFALGNFVGPSIAGVLYDQVGFRWGTAPVQGVILLMVVVTSLAKLYQDKRRQRVFNRQLYEELG